MRSVALRVECTTFFAGGFMQIPSGVAAGRAANTRPTFGRARVLVLSLSTWALALALGGCSDGDESGRPTESSTSALSVSLTEPTASTSVSRRALIVGKLSASSPVTVTVNSIPACVVGDTFFVNDLDLTGSTSITAVAIDSAAASASASVVVVKSDVPAFRVLAGSCGGPVPYVEEFSVASMGADLGSIVKIEADFDGNGIVTYTNSDVFAPIKFSYSKAGLYRAHFVLTNSLGKTTAYDRFVWAQSTTEATAPPRDAIRSLQTALRNKDVARALTLLTPGAADRYSSTLAGIQDKLPALADLLDLIQVGAISYGLVEFLVPVTQSGITLTFHLTMLRDENGTWKIDSL